MINKKYNIIIVSFICNLTLDGICYTFGVFLVPLMNYFELEEKGPISMIGNAISRNENHLDFAHTLSKLHMSKS